MSGQVATNLVCQRNHGFRFLISPTWSSSARGVLCSGFSDGVSVGSHSNNVRLADAATLPHVLRRQTLPGDDEGAVGLGL